MLRLWLMAMFAAAVLFTVKDQDVMHRAGLIGYCTTNSVRRRERRLARVREGQARRPS